MRRRALLLVCAAATCAAAVGDGDVVILDNRQRIAGTLEDDASNRDFVFIRSDKGTLRLRRVRIAGVELGLPSRMARIKDDDLAGLLDLARWCRAKGHNREALLLLDRARKLPGFSVEDGGLYATLIDELDGPDAALPLYVWYRRAKGADAGVLDRLRQLEQAGADTSGAGTAPAQVVAAKVPEPAAPKPAAEGLETKGWSAESPQYSNGSELKQVEVGAKEGFGAARKVLEIGFTGGDKDKAAVRRQVSYSVAPDAAVLSFKVANRGETPVKIAIAVKTGNWVFFESEQRLLPAGELKELRFDLRAAQYKSEATAWANSGRIQNLEDVKELQLLIYNGSKAGKVQIADLVFTGDKEL